MEQMNSNEITQEYSYIICETGGMYYTEITDTTGLKGAYSTIEATEDAIAKIEEISKLPWNCPQSLNTGKQTGESNIFGRKGSKSPIITDKDRAKEKSKKAKEIVKRGGF